MIIWKCFQIQTRRYQISAWYSIHFYKTTSVGKKTESLNFEISNTSLYCKRRKEMDGVVYVKAISRPSKKILLMKYFRKKKSDQDGRQVSNQRWTELDAEWVTGQRFLALIDSADTTKKSQSP